MAQDRSAQHDAFSWDGESPQPAGQYSRADLAFGASVALDLAEGRHPGHAHRVAYVGLELARAMHLAAAECAGVYYASLMHHVGAPAVAVGLAPAVNGDAPSRDGATMSHYSGAVATAAAELARRLSLPGTAITGIGSFVERWDGTGGPAGLIEGEIPVVARVVAVADFAERTVSGHQNPLKARAAVPQACLHAAGAALDPEMVLALHGLMKSDGFWLGLYDVRSADLLGEAGVASAERTGATRSSAATFAKGFASIVDAKTGYGTGHSLRVAGYAKAFAVALGLSAEMAEALWFAALWHDIGVLGVPHNVIAKPDLLTIDEMDHVRAHPQYSRSVFEATPAFEPMADWVAAHHERIDGKGYPDGLEGEDVPLQAQMLAIIDTFDALTSDRPYRRAMPRAEAMKVIWAQAGAQFEPSLIGVFETLVS